MYSLKCPCNGLLQRVRVSGLAARHGVTQYRAAFAADAMSPRVDEVMRRR